MSLSKPWETVKDRGGWRAAVHGAAKSCTQLGDWTEQQTGNTSKALQVLERNTTLPVHGWTAAHSERGGAAHSCKQRGQPQCQTRGRARLNRLQGKLGFPIFRIPVKGEAGGNNRAKGWGWGQSSTLKVSKLYPSKPGFKKAADP